jgi:hypothetical protein
MNDYEKLLNDIKGIEEYTFDEDTIKAYNTIQNSTSLAELLEISQDRLNDVRDLLNKLYNDRNINISFMHIVKSLKSVPADIDYI